MRHAYTTGLIYAPYRGPDLFKPVNQLINPVMKKLILTTMALTLVTAFAAEANNPLLKDFNTLHGTVPFSKIKLEHYIPAFEQGIREARADMEAVISNPDAPTFANTLEALENSGKLLDKVANIFFPLNSSETSDEMDQLANQIMPMIIAYSNDVSLNPELFKRVKTVYENEKDSPALSTEQRMLLTKAYKGFTRSGAGLDETDKEKYRAITTELSSLSLMFGQNVLAATNAFTLHIPASDNAKVDYMPEFVKAAMAEDAAARGLDGWIVTLQQPSFGPFLKYSKERDLKEQVWRAYNSRCYTGDEYDNSDMIRRMTELKMQLANLLGYETFADYVLEERMAESRGNVNDFLKELLDSTHDWAVQDVNEIAVYSKTLPDAPAELMPWDFNYYEEKYKDEKYSLNEERVKPYLKLENVEKGTFLLAEKLFGLTFRENKDIDVYHPDVKAFEVFDGDGSFLAVLYMDYFPRASKRGGAWMTSFRDMSTTDDGKEIRPHVSLNFNFTKPTADAPALLTFYELTTVLHEFGHGLHGMFAKGRYESLTGTSVYRDFVELPSQIMENWATEKEFLDLFAVHYQTGEKMPEELVEKIVVSKNYLAAYSNVRQLSFGMNDMAWHTITAPVTEDVGKFEKRAIAKTQILPAIDGTCMSPGFTHIFSGGYSAGYYSYKWAEVLEADAFSLFKEKGIFDKEVADSFRKNILEKGGSEHPMSLYVKFRGHKPETKALIEKIGEGR